MYDSQLAGKIGAWMLELEENTISIESRPPLDDSGYGNWFGMVEDAEVLGEDWAASELVSMSLGERNCDSEEGEDERSSIEMNRTWGPVVEWDVDGIRRVRVRCRQNFEAEDGSIGWSWKETEIAW